MGPLIVLVFAWASAPSNLAPSKVFGLGRVIASMTMPSASDGVPTSLEWDRHEKSLAILPYRFSDKGATLAVWPEMDTVSLNLAGDYYVRWSPDGRQILAGDHDSVYLLERKHLHVVRHLTHITNASWEHGRVEYQTGASPKLDDLPSTTGGKPKPLGTAYALTLDEGAGRLRAVITNAGFDQQYVPHDSPITHALSAGSMLDEEEYDGFFCVADRNDAYIGVPMRSLDASRLLVYRKGALRDVDFSHWKRVGAGKNDPLGDVCITLRPVRVAGRLIGFGQRFGEDVVISKHPSSVLLDFSSKTIYHTSQDVLALAGSPSGDRGAILIGKPDGKTHGSAGGKLSLISGR